MRRLRTFGGLAIECDGAALAVTAQRRTLALLAIIARAGDDGVSRDAIAALLWPDSDENQGRNALRQLLFRLRRDLGAPDVVAGTLALRLNPDVLSADVADFQRALAAGDFARAAEVYRGPFLAGFHLPDAPEFGRWADDQRTELGHALASALERLARDADRRVGGEQDAIRWWRRLVAHDPLSTRSTLGLMRALLAAGDPAEAVRHARFYETTVREELGVDADPAVSALVAQAGAAVARRSHPSPQQAGPTASDGRTTAMSADGPKTTAHGIGPPTPLLDRASNAPGAASPSAAASHAAPAETSGPALRLPGNMARSGGHDSAPRRGGPIAVVAMIIVLSALGKSGLIGRAAEKQRATALESTRLAVFPFAVRGRDADQPLGRAAADLLSVALDGAGPLAAVDPHAVRSALGRSREASVSPTGAHLVAGRLGAGRFVLGDIAVAGNRLVLTATSYVTARQDGPSEPSGTARVECDPKQLSAAVDRLAMQLLGATSDDGTDHVTFVAARSTQSLPALKAFLLGESRLRLAKFGPALDAYQRAVTEDTTFALAYYRLSVTADWASRQDLFDWGAAQATRFADRLADHERSLLRGLVAWHAGDARAAAAVYRAVVTRYPHDAEAWYQLGEAQFHLGPAYGSPVLDARPAFAQALALEPENRETMAHLQRLAVKAGDWPQADSLTRALSAGASEGESTLWLVVRAFSTGGDSTRARAMELLRRADDETVMHGAIRTAIFAENLTGARDIAEVLTHSSRPRAYQLAGAMQLGFLEMALGRRRRANASLDIADREVGVPMVGLRAAFAALPFVAVPRTELLALRDTAQRWPREARARADTLLPGWTPAQSRFHPWVLGMLSVRLGDLADADRQADRLDLLGAGAGTDAVERALTHDLAQVLRATIAQARGDPQRALALVVSETAPLPNPAGLQSPFGSRAHQRYLRGALLAAAGRDDEALRWFDSIGDLSVPELIFLAPAELGQAAIYERRGDRVRAAAHYRRVLALWRDADPELRPLVRDTERRLALLTAK